MKTFSSLGVVVGLAIVSFAPVYADEPWMPVPVPAYWEKQHGGVIDDHDGYAWYRCFVRLPADWKGDELTLELGRIDDCDTAYLNGVRIGESGTINPYKTASNVERRYKLVAKDVNFGAVNLIAVRVFDGGGAGGIYQGPVRIIGPRGAINLQGRWQFRKGDDPAWAVLHVNDNADALADEFAKQAGETFGKSISYTPLPGTRKLDMQGDIASQLVDGVDRFLLNQIEQSVERRARHWNRDFASREAYEKSIQPNRARLAHILGVRDPRVAFDRIEVVTTSGEAGLVGRGPTYDIYAVRWPVLGYPGPNWPNDPSIHGEGLLLTPREGKPVCDLIALPDADQSPEQIAGLADGVPVGFQFARRLAEHGCRVIVPTLISREMKPRHGRANLTNREYVYRSAFELGRHVIGYEVQKVLACVDWFDKQAGGNARVGVIGHGEGGMIALYAAAIDPRIDGVTVTGHLDNRSTIWRQPIDRNVFGLLDQFGDAELLTMVFPRAMVLEAGGGPRVTLPSNGGAPADLQPADPDVARAEIDRAGQILKAAKFPGVSGNTYRRITDPAVYDEFLSRMPAYILDGRFNQIPPTNKAPHTVDPLPDAAARQQRQLNEMDRHNQGLLAESPYVRQQYMKRLYDAAKSLDEYNKVAAEYRAVFRDEVIGSFDIPLLPADPRTRMIDQTDKWDRYEVVLDVWEDVIAYGILTIPRGMKPDEKRPVVVCQHGLEGRPQHVIGAEGYNSYKAYATQLAERGFITFAPQNLYIFTDRFRSLQRKANPLGKTLFSIITPQHQQIINFLKTLPNVDGDRIAFYGLSYGGKTAMRVPALLTDYCLSICSADFNEWVWKNASTRAPYSYVWTGEYEIFEWDLGSTFNYAEMAALIAPRPFMVERGHFDGVAPDETVAYEFAKVRHHYQARLGLTDKTEIEWFVGPHTINGKGTFEFLHRHLKWPTPER